MRLVNVLADGAAHAGACKEDGSIVALERLGPSSIEELIAAGRTVWAQVESAVERTDATWPSTTPLTSPITRPPRNLFCVGLNYESHLKEGGRSSAPMSAVPIIFTKPWTTLLGPHADLAIDTSVTEKVDWEAELAVVIGEGGRNIAADQAMQHVFGYALANDVSARDLQLSNGPGSQWDKGKSLDGFCPFGPYLVGGAALPDLAELRVNLTVNGELKQDFKPSEMHHSIPVIIDYLSRGMALLPGDVILTGTAAGVGMWQEPPQFLRAGDLVEITCDGLGAQRTGIVSIAPSNN
jgi:2-keto-4-pentenoate hydratase/2-oxohepta-3-ene-1,7-dioic acid hydratase in catechol pathway